jgi:hypothetical protein
MPTASQSPSQSVLTLRLTIHGLPLAFPARYRAGHVLTEVEAGALNSNLCDNLRNNFTAKVKAALEAEKAPDATGLSEFAKDKLRAEFATYVQGYEFGIAKTGTTVDPVERESRKIAKEAILAKLRKNGIPIESKPEGWLDAAIESLLTTNSAIRAEAARRIEAARSVADSFLMDEKA